MEFQPFSITKLALSFYIIGLDCQLREVIKNGYFMVSLTVRGGGGSPVGPDRKEMWKFWPIFFQWNMPKTHLRFQTIVNSFSVTTNQSQPRVLESTQVRPLLVLSYCFWNISWVQNLCVQIQLIIVYENSKLDMYFIWKLFSCPKLRNIAKGTTEPEAECSHQSNCF